LEEFSLAEHTVAMTDDNFKGQVLDSTRPVLVDFWAPWCGPCVAIAPTLEALAEEYKGRITIGKMNVDENANIPASYGVRSIPYLALFKGGEVVDSIVGSVPKARLSAMLDKVLA
jgi:thioredoxin 1